MVNLGKEVFTELVSGDIALPEKFRVRVLTYMSGEGTVVNNMSILKNECKPLKSEYSSIREEEYDVYGFQKRWMTKYSF